MKTFYLLKGLICLVLTVGFLSCDDHRIPAVAPGSVPDRMRVKTITQYIPDVAGRKASSTQKVSSFSYDAQGRLSMIVTFQAPDSTVAPVENSVFTYNGQNRLTELRREIVRRSGVDPNPYETYTYSYNEAGQMSELNYSNNSIAGDNHWKITLQYSPDNQLVSSRKVYAPGGLQYTETSTYTFTGNNLTSATTNFVLFKVTTLSDFTSTTTYTYDTNVNPFYGTFVIPAPFMVSLANPQGGNLDYYTYYGGVDNRLNLSQNNTLSAGTITYAYTYNGSHLPTSRTTTVASEVTETLTYAYESY